MELARTGISFKIPPGYFGLMIPAAPLIYRFIYINEQIVYPGVEAELMVILNNQSAREQVIKAKEAILDLMFIPHYVPRVINIGCLEPDVGQPGPSTQTDTGTVSPQPKRRKTDPRDPWDPDTESDTTSDSDSSSSEEEETEDRQAYTENIKEETIKNIQEAIQEMLEDPGPEPLDDGESDVEVVHVRHNAEESESDGEVEISLKPSIFK
jgi:hypothetical protein